MWTWVTASLRCPAEMITTLYIKLHLDKTSKNGKKKVSRFFHHQPGSKWGRARERGGGGGRIRLGYTIWTGQQTAKKLKHPERTEQVFVHLLQLLTSVSCIQSPRPKTLTVTKQIRSGRYFVSFGGCSLLQNSVF